MFDIFRSLQNLLCNKEDKERNRYISKEGEDLLYRLNKRLRDEFPETRLESGTPNALGKYSQPIEIDSAIANVFSRYRTNAITGYAARVAEELHTGKRSQSLNKGNIELLIDDFIEWGRKMGGDDFKYSKKDLANPIDKHLIFCEALTSGNLGVSEDENADDGKYLNFTLENKRAVQKLLNRIINQNLQWTLEATKKTSSGLYQTYLFGKLASAEAIEQKVVGDVIFGYCVRLGESLYPF